MPDPGRGTAITLSPFRRPTIECATTDAKAGCLYPNNARALVEAQGRGFDNAVLCDMLGNVAELATANLFLARDGVVHDPGRRTAPSSPASPATAPSACCARTACRWSRRR